MTQAVAASQFISIPSHILHADISKTALRVYLALAAEVCHSGLGPESSEPANGLDSRLRGNDAEYKVSVNCKNLGELLSRSASTIRRAVRELAQHGLIEFAKEWVNRATRVFRMVMDAAKNVARKCRVLPSEARRTDEGQGADREIPDSNPSPKDEIPGQARDDGEAARDDAELQAPDDGITWENAKKEVYADSKTYPHVLGNNSEKHEIKRIGEAMVDLGLELPSMVRLLTKYGHKNCGAEIKRVKHVYMMGGNIDVTEDYFEKGLKVRANL